MNMIDNGIHEVLNIERIITEEDLYFKVTFKDYYNSVQVKHFSSIKDLENKHWVE
jgi:hypothetical protein